MSPNLDAPHIAALTLAYRRNRSPSGNFPGSALVSTGDAGPVILSTLAHLGLLKRIDRDGHGRSTYTITQAGIVWLRENGHLVVISGERLSGLPAHDLLPDAIRAQLPPLYTGEALGLDALAVVKFFTPDSGWSWYASEFDGNDLFFGLVDGFEVELGYFSLTELEDVRGKLGLPVERDETFQPLPLREVKRLAEERRAP